MSLNNALNRKTSPSVLPRGLRIHNTFFGGKRGYARTNSHPLSPPTRNLSFSRKYIYIIFERKQTETQVMVHVRILCVCILEIRYWKERERLSARQWNREARRERKLDGWTDKAVEG